MKRNKRNTDESAKKNDRYSCEIDTAWFDGANYESNSIIHGAFGQVCSRIFSSRIKGRGQDEVCGRHDAPGVWIFEPVLGGRLYSRPWTFHSVNVLWYCVNGFVPLSTRDFLRSFQCVTTGVFALFTRRKLLKLLQDIVRLVEDIVVRYLKFLWGNQDINLDWLLCFYEILSFS